MFVYGGTFMNLEQLLRIDSNELKADFINGELIEFIKGEPFKNGNGYYLKPGRLVKFQYKII
jgi:hypothetical protein